MLVNSRRALRVAGVCLVVAGVLSVLVALPATLAVVHRVDDAWLGLMVDLRTPVVVVVAEVLAVLGSGFVNWPLRLAVIALLAVRRRWLQLTAFAVAVATSAMLTGAMKVLYARARPPGGLLDAVTYSYPSGHAVAGVITAVGLVVVLLPPGPTRWRWELCAAIFAVVMALSRTYLAVHWLSDVVAGGSIGTALAIGWPALLQQWRDRPRVLRDEPEPEPRSSQ